MISAEVMSLGDHLTADQRIQREKDLLDNMAAEVASLSATNLARHATEWSALAERMLLCATEAQGKMRQTFLGIAGNYVMRAQIFAAAAQAAPANDGPRAA